MSEPTQITAQNYADARRIVQRSTATDLLQQPDGSYSPVTVVAPSSPVNSPIPTVSRAVGSFAGRRLRGWSGSGRLGYADRTDSVLGRHDHVRTPPRTGAVRGRFAVGAGRGSGHG